MSRIGKLPINVPSGVTVNIAGEMVTVKGPKGELKRSLPAEMGVKQEGAVLTVTRPSDNQKHRSYHGLTRSLLARRKSRGKAESPARFLPPGGSGAHARHHPLRGSEHEN
jgi:hypothetical protein